MFNKKMVAMAMTVPLVMGTITTVSALEKTTASKARSVFAAEKSNRIFKRKCCAVWIKSRPFRLTIYFYNRNVSSFIC